jgi:hypothetical protein
VTEPTTAAAFCQCQDSELIVLGGRSPRVKMSTRAGPAGRRSRVRGRRRTPHGTNERTDPGRPPANWALAGGGPLGCGRHAHCALLVSRWHPGATPGPSLKAPDFGPNDAARARGHARPAIATTRKRTTGACHLKTTASPGSEHAGLATGIPRKPQSPSYFAHRQPGPSMTQTSAAVQ